VEETMTAVSGFKLAVLAALLIASPIDWELSAPMCNAAEPETSLGLTRSVQEAADSRLKVQPFDLADVTLLDGPFKDAMDHDRDYLFTLDPDRFLHQFRVNAGLPPKAPLYGGWESPDQGAGRCLGHYLSALSLYYRATGDSKAKQRIDYIVGELALCQRRTDHGMLTAENGVPAAFAELQTGNVAPLKKCRVPWYIQHKMFAGLRDAYELAGNEQAKEVLIKLADWAIYATQNLTYDQWQSMLEQEQGGMNEVLADVYAITGDAKYLDLAKKFYHAAVMDPLAAQVDKLTGLHANTQIPKVIGIARQFELTGDDKDRVIAEYFWDRVVGTRTYIIGGDSEGEHFGAPNDLADKLTPETAETCNTYNMLKLTRHLFEWTADPKYADYYERALYNHVLASQEPKQGMMTYFVSLKPGHFKTYSTPFDSFWCCVGTGMENHVKYGDSIYYHSADSLYVNLYIPSIVNWQDKGLTVRQDTTFPQSDTSRFTIMASKSIDARILLRYPDWATNGISVTVNGKSQKISQQPDSYVAVDRKWKSGDTLIVTLPMSLHTAVLPDDPSKFAILDGPIVLAAQLGSDGITGTMPYGKSQLDYVNVPDPPVPAVVDNGSPVTTHLTPVAGQSMTFTMNGLTTSQPITLRPFYQTYYDRYTIYWNTAKPTVSTSPP
jgi:DUF1680 family protein